MCYDRDNFRRTLYIRSYTFIFILIIIKYRIENYFGNLELNAKEITFNSLNHEIHIKCNNNTYSLILEILYINL